jgi:hypothetical protein
MSPVLRPIPNRFSAGLLAMTPISGIIATRELQAGSGRRGKLSRAPQYKYNACNCGYMYLTI